tara:strand:- start:522 stop:1661 length:1140 start_codon:yes stop_codon:yes gene_type:complete
MGDSGDQGQDTDEFTSDAELDQIAADAQAIQDARDSGSEDTTDSLTIADLNTIADRAGIQGQVDDFQQMQDQTNQEKVAQQQAFAQNMANMARQSLQDTIEEERGMAGDLTLADLTPNVTATVPTTFTQGSIFDVDDFSKATDDRTITQRGDIQKQTLENLLNVTPNVKNMMRDQTDASDFNIAGSKAAADLRERAKGSLSPTMQGMLPFGNLINTLTGLPAQRTIDALNRGEVPDFQNMKDGQIQGTTGKGFGADQTEGYIGGLSINAPGAPGGLNTLPIPNFVEPEETTDDGGESEPKKIVPPKKPTDPCPEGFQLIDGACTPVGGVETDTGFVVFPPGRDPSFKRGPFSPTTVATNPGIRGLNPITFNIPQNPFKR